MTIALKSLFLLYLLIDISPSFFFPLPLCPSLTCIQSNQNPTHPTKPAGCLLLLEAFPDRSQPHQNESPLPGIPLAFVYASNWSFFHLAGYQYLLFSLSPQLNGKLHEDQDQVLIPHSPHCTRHSPGTQWVLWTLLIGWEQAQAEGAGAKRGGLAVLGWQCSEEGIRSHWYSFISNLA